MFLRSRKGLGLVFCGPKNASGNKKNNAKKKRHRTANRRNSFEKEMTPIQKPPAWKRSVSEKTAVLSARRQRVIRALI